MDPASLILSVAGLYGICAEVLERIRSYKDFGPESRAVVARFDAAMLRLKEWARRVGIHNDGIASVHHSGLDDPSIASVIRKILFSLCETFNKVEDIQTSLRLVPSTQNAASYALPNPSPRDLKSQSTPMNISRKGGLRWAWRHRGRFLTQVETFEGLVDTLCNIIPPEASLSSPFPTSVHYHIAANDATHVIENLANVQRDLRIKLVTEWLDVTKAEHQYDQFVLSRLEGTCDWFFKSPSYRAWVSDDFSSGTAKFLWLCGPPGYGKTVLSARIVEILQNDVSFPKAQANFFASNHVLAGGQPQGAIRSWVLQLIQSNEDALDIVQGRPRSGSGFIATQTEIWAIFHELVTNIASCTFVLDGLDEYNPNVRAEFLKRLQTAVTATTTRVLITSRDEADLASWFSSAAADPGQIAVSELHISEKDVQSDINLYSRSVVNERLPKKDLAFRQQLATELAEKCEGMFLWIKLQQNQLRGGKGQNELRRLVQSMPTGLDHSYERYWNNIQSRPENERRRAVAILSWATFALRPLTVAELTDALVVDLNDSSPYFCVENLPDDIDDEYIQDEIKGLCGCLIEIRSTIPEQQPGERTIHLVHASVREYLHSILRSPADTGLNTGHGNAELAKTCLQYINYRETWVEQTSGRRKSAPFREYSAASWFLHVNTEVLNDQKLIDLANTFFRPDNPNFECWTEYYESIDTLNSEEGETKRVPSTALYYAALLNIVPTMKYLKSFDLPDIDVGRGRYGTALQAACIKGHHEAFNILIGWGADPNSMGGQYGAPLNAAAAKGNIFMVNRLLEKGAALECHDRVKRTPLYSACKSGHLEVVKLLLEKGADLTVKDNDGCTPLSLASYNGYFEVVKLLLEKGADLTVTDNDGWTPLNLASYNGYFEVVKFFLEKGADVNAINKNGFTPLHAALPNGHFEVVKLLLEKGADLSIVSKDELTPLHAVSSNGHFEVVKLFLEKGADLNIVSKDGLTPLHAASSNGHFEVVKFFLEKGADLNAVSKNGFTPFHAASSNGHFKVVKLLLKKGAHLNAVSKDGITPLYAASLDGHFEVVKLLLEKGADLNAINKDGLTPLHVASLNGHFEMVKFLLKKGTDLAIVENDGWTPLNLTSNNGHLETVKLILGKGADPNAANKDGLTPLHAASSNGHTEIVKVILNNEKNNVQADSKDQFGRTPLSWASARGHDAIITLLLAKDGIDPNSRDQYGQTPLFLAVCNGHEAAVEVLLANNSVDLESKDTFGRTPFLWAAKRGHMSVVELLRKESKERGVIIHGVLDIATTPASSEKGRIYCDICLACIPDIELHYHCRICSCGDFDLCQDCFVFGAHCIDKSHELIKRVVRGDDLVEFSD